MPLDKQLTKMLHWLSLDEEVPAAHASGKIAVVGHTVQRTGMILDLPHLKCLDTGCGYGGPLSALDLSSGELWQVSEK